MDLSGSGKSYIVSHLTKFEPELILNFWQQYYTQGEDGGARYNIELCVSILPPLN